MDAKEDHQARAVADTRLTVLVDSAPGAIAVAKALNDADRTSHIRVFDQCSRAVANAQNLLVFSSASKLDQVAECVSIANKAHRLAALLVYHDVAANWLPYVLHESGLRALRNMIVHSDPELPTRILSAWAMGGEHDFIADAAVIRDRLVVRSCAFDEYSVSFDAFPALRAIPDSARSSFVLEEEGLLLYWPDSHVHLDLEDIRFANDPKREQAARTSRIGEQRGIGVALRQLREEAGLKQSEINGISERQVRRVESGHRLTVGTLDAFATAMRVDPDYLLERLSEVIDEVEPMDLVSTEHGSAREPSKDLPADGTDVLVLAYPLPSSVNPSQRSTTVRENLQLAADSVEDPKPRRWNLHAANVSIHGFLEHDFRTDELMFVIDEVRSPNPESRPVSIAARSSRLPEPLISIPFVPRANARVCIANGQGIVPRDVSNLELRVVNEP